MPLMNSLNAGSWRERRFFAAGLLVGLVLPALLSAATGTVSLDGGGGPKQRERRPSPALASLPKPAASGPLKILLVDDDWSDNNQPGGNGALSRSDQIYRDLVAAAVEGDASWSVDVVDVYKSGPALDRLRDFNVVLWYTGGSYGGGNDNVAVLSREDEKTVRSYLEETGGVFILVSPGYVNNYSYANTWIDALCFPR